MEKHILVVDDEACMRDILSVGLTHAGFMVTTAPDADAAHELINAPSSLPVSVDFLLTDFNLPGLTGLDLVEILRREGVDLPCFLMSGDQSAALASEALERGCLKFFPKPFRVSALVEGIREALEAHSMEEQPLVSSAG
jgi:DNA-binding NtrC family response regulator